MNKNTCDYNCDDCKRSICIKGGQDLNEEEILEYYEECSKEIYNEIKRGKKND